MFNVEYTNRCAGALKSIATTTFYTGLGGAFLNPVGALCGATLGTVFEVAHIPIAAATNKCFNTDDSEVSETAKKVASLLAKGLSLLVAWSVASTFLPVAFTLQNVVTHLICTALSIVLVGGLCLNKESQ